MIKGIEAEIRRIIRTKGNRKYILIATKDKFITLIGKINQKDSGEGVCIITNKRLLEMSVKLRLVLH